MSNDKKPADQAETITEDKPADAGTDTGGAPPPDDQESSGSGGASTDQESDDAGPDTPEPIPADDQADPVKVEPDGDPPDDPPPDDDLPLAAKSEAEFVDKTGKPLSGAALSAAKKKADTKRRKAAIVEVAASTPEPSEELIAEDERRNKIADLLIEIDDEVQGLDSEASKLREKQQALMLEMYPPKAGNDLHSTAVRGYLKASARERAHRALAPQRMKAMLKAAGMAPIDAAMQRKRARGMTRPVRKLLNQAAAAALDQAKDAIPDKNAEKTE